MTTFVKLAREGFIEAFELYFEPLTKLWRWWKSRHSLTPKEEAIWLRLDSVVDLLEVVSGRLVKLESPPPQAKLEYSPQRAPVQPPWSPVHPSAALAISGPESDFAAARERAALSKRLDMVIGVIEDISGRVGKLEPPPQMVALPAQIRELLGNVGALAAHMERAALPSRLDMVVRGLKEVSDRVAELEPPPQVLDLPAQIQKLSGRVTDLAAQLARVESLVQTASASSLDTQAVYVALSEIRNEVSHALQLRAAAQSPHVLPHLGHVGDVRLISSLRQLLQPPSHAETAMALVVASSFFRLRKPAALSSEVIDLFQELGEASPKGSSSTVETTLSTLAIYVEVATYLEREGFSEAAVAVMTRAAKLSGVLPSSLRSAIRGSE